MLPLEPFLLERIALPKVWGGRMLAQVPGIELPPEQNIGETWELFDRPEGSSRLRGRTTTLADLMATMPDALVGAGVPRGHRGRFPLVLKFLDAREQLSLQVHPSDTQTDVDSGKNEACVVLHAGARARITYGFRAGVSHEHFRAAIDRGSPTGEVEAMLASFRPIAGDTIHIPPGTVHAIGPDVVAFEIQQNSDVTYRLHDFGRGRELHVEQASAVMRVEPPPHEPPIVTPVTLDDGGVQLVATRQFRMRRYALRQPLDLRTNGRYLSITVVAGRGTLRWPGGRADGTLDLVPGDTALVPACTARVALQPRDHLDMILCDPGEP